MSARPLILVLGPTATGKTDLAIAIARRVGGEIVSADAFAVYRGLDIGTAKASQDARREIPHHLIDVASPREAFSAGRWVEGARRAIAQIEGRDRIPILAGGSHFYIRALLLGLPGEEVVSPSLRGYFGGEWTVAARRARKRMLDLLDPLYGARVPAADTARIARALEIIFSTGVRVSERSPADTGLSGRPLLKLALQFSRQDIYTRVHGRVSAMWQTDWALEVENLLGAGVPLGAPAFRAIGYRELAAVATGELSSEEAFRRTVSRSRALVKRQETWLASEAGLERCDFAAAVERAAAFVEGARA